MTSAILLRKAKSCLPLLHWIIYYNEVLPASEFVIYFCWKLCKAQKCRGNNEKRVEEVRIFLTFGPKVRTCCILKITCFYLLQTFFLWCRRYESALYGWVITTWSFIFFGSKINISPVIFYGLFYGWNIVYFIVKVVTDCCMHECHC